MISQFGLTDKQFAFAMYILERLGFSRGEDLDTYITYLEKIANNYKRLGALKFEELKDDNPRYKYYTLRDNYWMPDNFGLVDLLYAEYSYKRKYAFEDLANKSKHISATDLANYTYCPIGYSISKSFAMPSNLLAERGSDLHEQHRLIKKIKGNKTSFDVSNKNLYINEKNKYFFDEIELSEAVFYGHDAGEKGYFINEEINFIGQPDYIFKDKDGRLFVVEEKFKQINYQSVYFSNNHKVQLAAYIYYLNQYKIEYGYLVYWIYNFYDGESHIEECYVLRVDRNQTVEIFLETTFSEVQKFNINKSKQIDLNTIKPKKCANCVHTIICSHKNKKRDLVSLPYDRSYFQLYPAQYPAILSKQ